jgi:hypothetical protein
MKLKKKSIKKDLKKQLKLTSQTHDPGHKIEITQ